MLKRSLLVTLAICAVYCSLATAQSPKFVLIHSFSGKWDGSYPAAGLIIDTAGNLYGTTSSGASFLSGSVFKVSPWGKVTTLHAFDGFGEGGQPRADLIQDPQGNLYGTASVGGANFYGTIFKLDNSGKFSMLHAFAAKPTDVVVPAAGLALDASGNLYGTAVTGGGHAQGGVFRFGIKGWQKVLYSFQLSPDGSAPYGQLLRDSHGNLFGTTIGGGTANCGTVFKLDRTGAETVVFNFPCATAGQSPMAGLIQDSAGNLYGTTYGTTGIYAPFYYGTIFKIDTNGVESVLYSFTGGADGGNPVGKLLMDPNGNLYGTTFAGGDSNDGVVFKVDGTGQYTVLHSFSGADGAGPQSTLVSGANGTLYGTTTSGGAYNQGTVFKIMNP